MSTPNNRYELEPENPPALKDMSVMAITAVMSSRLGPKLFAHAINAEPPEILTDYMTGKQIPSEETVLAMRGLAEVTDYLLNRDSPDVVRAIMVGQNPLLQDKSPIELFNEGNGERVVQAAPNLRPN